MEQLQETPRNYTESEIEKLVQKVNAVLKRYLKKKLIENIGNREVDPKKIELLNNYWVTLSTVFLDMLNPIFLKKPDKMISNILNAVNGSEEEIIKFFTIRLDERTSGIMEYSGYLGEDLNKIISSKITGGSDNKMQILDIGCADGFFLNEVNNKYKGKIDVWGLAPKFEGAEKKPDVNFRIGLIEMMPEEFNSKFDLVTTVNTVMYSIDPASSFEQASQSLTKDGVLLFACGTVKPSFSERTLTELFNMTYKEYLTYFMNQHVEFQKEMRTKLQNKEFEINGRKFTIEENTPIREAWTPTVYKITRIS